MQSNQDQRNLLGIFDLTSVSIDGRRIIKPRSLYIYRDSIVIDEIEISFSRVKEIIQADKKGDQLTFNLSYKDVDDLIKTIQITGVSDNGPSSMEYCQIMICRCMMSSHVPIKNKDKACYGILGY